LSSNNRLEASKGGGCLELYTAQKNKGNT
jgi:hypothetical protein